MDSGKTNLNATFKKVLDLQSLDERGQVMDAFAGYLGVVSDILVGMGQTKALTEVEGQPAVALKHCDKLFVLARNCLDRAEALTSTKKEAERKKSTDSSEAINSKAPTSPVAVPKKSGPAIKAVNSMGEEGSLEDLEGSGNVSVGNMFLIKAQRKNKAMYQNYKSKMDQLDERARSEMKMRLHRAMQENIDMAKAKKAEFEAKMESIRLGTVNQTKALTDKRREAVDLFMKLPFSNSLSHVLETLTKTLSEFGDNSAQEKEFTLAVTSKPQDAEIVYREVVGLLRSFTHPIGQYMQQYSVKFKQQYQEQVMQKGNGDPEVQSLLQTMTAETHAFNTSLYEKIMERYSFLNPMSSFVRRAIEDELFSGTSRVLLTAFEKKYHHMDDSMFLRLCLIQDVTPGDLGIKEKFRLEDFEGQDLRSVPYSTAVVTFKKISMAFTPTEKANILAQSITEISQCVRTHWESKGVEIIDDKYAIGADDLLPILSYIIIKANSPALRSQTAFLGEFINEMLAMGEEGYAMATLETAVDFLETFELDRSKKN